MWKKLKVIELKDALKLRGCIAKGNKPALISRLKDSIEKNLEVVCDIGEGGVETFAGGGFSVGAKWELEAHERLYLQFTQYFPQYIHRRHSQPLVPISHQH